MARAGVGGVTASGAAAAAAAVGATLSAAGAPASSLGWSIGAALSSIYCGPPRVSGMYQNVTFDIAAQGGNS